MWTRIRRSLTLRVFLITLCLMVAACLATYGAIAYLTPITYTSMLEDELDRRSAELISALSEAPRAEYEALLSDFARETGARLRLTAEDGSEIYSALPPELDMPSIFAVSSATECGVVISSAAQAQADKIVIEEGVTGESGASESVDAESITAESAAMLSTDAESITAESAARSSDALDPAPSTEARISEARAGAESADAESITAESAAMLSADAESITAESAARFSDALYPGAAVEEITLRDFPSALSSYILSLSDGGLAELCVAPGARAVNQASEAMLRTLPYLLLLILAASLLTSLIYARLIARPILRIARIAKRIAAQDFGARWTDRRADEIGMLGDSLNALSDSLSGAMAELRGANAQLQRDIDRERELERQRSAFFSAASHELKTPVTILRGQLSGMLAQVGAYRDREKYLARALEVTGRMESLIREILTISRIEAGGFALETDEIDLGALVRSQLDLDAELIEQRQMRASLEMEPHVLLRGNRKLLENALDNVLMNAILYSPPRAELRISLCARTLRIENTGVSIPPEALPQLFTPFFRVERSRNRSSGGSGLGLYLVASILKLHRAAFEIQNTPDGVAFIAEFP